MSLREALPWNWGKKEVPVTREDDASRLPSRGGVFDVFDLGNPFRMPSWPSLSGFPFGDDGRFMPVLDAKETDDEVRITVELPGLDEKDVEVRLKDDVLTVRGEKHDESKHEKGGAQWVERRYGSFQRMIPLPHDVDVDEIKAHFKSGVLTVVAPRTGKAEDGQRSIPIQAQ